ncbi:MAG: PEP-CTERM sorting domain-containing protein [Crocosphaera sp.]|nr:PEP-CTERM sorting domain-containing protein [Crocosphaera sp.]
MFNLKSAALGAAFVGTTVTMTLTAEVAQALTLGVGDTLNITGQATFSLLPDVPSDTIDFLTGQVESDSTGGFFTQYVVGPDDLLSFGVSDIDITQVSGNLYSGVATNPLLTFTDGVTFVANNPFSVTRVANGTFGVNVTFDPFSGTFVGANGAVVAEGLFSAQQFFYADGSYSMTLTAVPEPLTMLGAGTAIAFGGAFKRKVGKKSKKGSTKA